MTGGESRARRPQAYGAAEGYAPPALPWSYRRKIQDFLKPESRILDMDPGDGALLLSLRHPFGLTSVSESRAEALRLCEKSSRRSASPCGRAGRAARCRMRTRRSTSY